MSLVRVLVLVLSGMVLSTPGLAVGLTIDQTVHWRDVSTPNTVGFLTGDVLFFGALSVVPSGAGTSVQATQGGVTLPLFFLGGGPGDIFPNQYGRNVFYNPALTGSWVLTGTRGAETATNTTPAPGAVASVPFANNVTIGGAGTTPTISWTIPTGVAVDRVRIGVFDDQQPAAPRKPIIFESAPIAPSTTSFTIPAGLLTAGHRYVARVELQETYDHTLTGGIRSRSNAFFALMPLRVGAPSVVYLPIVDGSGFTFHLSVEPGVTYFLDPQFAIGYQYTIGAGDPNFASVLLPSIGDGLFDLVGCNGASLGSATAGVARPFGPGGVSCFKVLGIEESAGLDPKDPTAFITGLTFTADGQFTGTMEPIVTPEPGTLLLVGTSVVGLGLARWRKQKRNHP